MTKSNSGQARRPRVADGPTARPTGGGLSTVTRLAKRGELTKPELMLALKLVAALEDNRGVSSKFLDPARAEVGAGQFDQGRAERREAARIDRRRLLSGWISAMNRSEAQLSPVVALLSGEMNLSGLDRHWRRRSGWAKTQLILALRVLDPGSNSRSGNSGLDNRE